jgi:dephospho-CoA kinase
MKRILLTGMSGTGKSTLVRELTTRGFRAIDLDSDEWSHWVDYTPAPDEPGSPVEPNRDWVWREDRVRDLLDGISTEPLFLSGCAMNMGQFYSYFDQVVLLSASPAVTIERLTTRTNNPYGKRSDELARVLDLKQSVEPLLRKRATLEIDTAAPLSDVIATLMRHCGIS